MVALEGSTPVGGLALSATGVVAPEVLVAVGVGFVDAGLVDAGGTAGMAVFAAEVAELGVAFKGAGVAGTGC